MKEYAIRVNHPDLKKLVQDTEAELPHAIVTVPKDLQSVTKNNPVVKKPPDDTQKQLPHATAIQWSMNSDQSTIMRLVIVVSL